MKSFNDISKCKNIKLIDNVQNSKEDNSIQISNISENVRELNRSSELRGNTELTLIDHYGNPMDDISEEEKQRDMFEIQQNNEEIKDITITPLTPKFTTPKHSNMKGSYRYNSRLSRVHDSHRLRYSGIKSLSSQQNLSKLQTLNRVNVKSSVELPKKVTHKSLINSQLNPSLRNSREI